MKILRSENRRGFSVGSAGYFVILKPNTWFPASRFPERFRYHGSEFAESPTVNDPVSHVTTIPPQIILLSTKDRRLMRTALVVLAAIAITLGLLWWIMSSAPPNAY
jgi:hypothetical protein